AREPSPRPLPTPPARRGPEASVAPGSSLARPIAPGRRSTAGPSAIALCRGAFFRAAHRLIDREPGGLIRRLGDADPALAQVLVQATPSGWLPLDDLVRVFERAGAAGGDPVALARRTGAAAMTSTLALHFGADPATLGPAALLRAAETFWPRYHNW